MGNKYIRKPFKIGGTKAITLPKSWLDYYGNRCEEITLLGDSLLILVPAGLEERAQYLLDTLDGVSNNNLEGDFQILWGLIMNNAIEGSITEIGGATQAERSVIALGNIARALGLSLINMTRDIDYDFKVGRG